MMNGIETVDARGLSCPQPVLETKKAIDRIKSGTIEIIVDTATSMNNISRFARTKGWKVTSSSMKDGDFKVTISKVTSS